MSTDPVALANAIKASWDSDGVWTAASGAAAAKQDLADGVAVPVAAAIDAAGGGGGGSSLTIKDEGTTKTTAATSIDFVGGEVTATNTGGAVTVTIPTVTSVSGNAGTATALQTARNIAGHSFDGTADVSPTTADVPDSLNKRYVTDAQLTVIGNTSGTNSGNETKSNLTPIVAGVGAAGVSTELTRADHVHPAQTTVSGNAGTATTLQTARTVNAVSFNGSANIITNWGLDQRPASPHASDDEFESGSLAAWTTGGSQQVTAIDPYGTFSTATQWRYDNNSMRPSWLMIQPTADAAYLVPIHKAVTVPSNFMVWARLSFNSRSSATVANNDSGIGIGLSASSAGAPDFNNFVLLFLNEANNNDKAIRWQSTAASVAAATGALSLTDTGNVNAQYMLIQKISSTIHFWCADHSGNWLYLGNQTNAAAFDRVFIRVANAATTTPGNMIVGIDFVRFYAGADKLP